MASFKANSCSLCLEPILDKNFEVLDSFVKEILDVLLLSLKFNDGNCHVMCGVCSKKLNSALEFKSKCLSSDDTIFPYIDGEKTLQLDLREIYKKEYCVDISDDKKICRLCMQPVETDFRCIQEEEIAAIHKLVPDMNCGVIKDPVICIPCFDSLGTHNGFLKECLEVQERIRNTCRAPLAKRLISLPVIKTDIKTENTDIKIESTEYEWTEMSIKTEPIEIKSEGNVGDSDGLLPCLTGRPAKSVDRHCRTLVLKRDNEPQRYKRATKTEPDTDFASVQPTPSGSLQESDPSETEDDNPSAVMYSCHMCSFETKYVSSLKKHMKIRHDPSGNEKFKCDACDYRASSRKILLWHLVNVHKAKQRSAVESMMYKCDFCEFRTKHNTSIKYHLLMHKDASEVKMFKCEDCSFETRQKWYFARHRLRHTDSFQPPKHKCDACDFETRYSYTFKVHRKKHDEGIQIYKCDHCDYATLVKKRLKDHRSKGHLRK